MQKFRRIVRKRKTELTAACLLLLLSLAMAFAGSWFYRQYRKQVIQTEESQLLTMAGIIGNNLNTYLDEQLKPVSYTHLYSGTTRQYGQSPWRPLPAVWY